MMSRHVLRGEITTRYTNNSGDTLDFLWIHLWPNAYKNGQTALAQQKFRQGEMFMFWALQRDLGGIDSLDFAVDGVAAEWSYHPQHIDIAKLTLPQAARARGIAGIRHAFPGATAVRQNQPTGAHWRVLPDHAMVPQAGGLRSRRLARDALLESGRVLLRVRLV